MRQIIFPLLFTSNKPRQMKNLLIYIDIFHSGFCLLIILDCFPLIFGDEKKSKSFYFKMYTFYYSPSPPPISISGFLLLVASIYTALIGLWLAVSRLNLYYKHVLLLEYFLMHQKQVSVIVSSVITYPWLYYIYQVDNEVQ